MSTDWGFYCETCKKKYIIEGCRSPEACYRILLCRGTIERLLLELRHLNQRRQTITYGVSGTRAELRMWGERVPLDFFEAHLIDGHWIVVANEYYDMVVNNAEHRYPFLEDT